MKAHLQVHAIRQLFKAWATPPPTVMDGRAQRGTTQPHVGFRADDMRDVMRIVKLYKLRIVARLGARVQLSPTLSNFGTDSKPGLCRFSCIYGSNAVSYETHAQQ
jgi:hypothetical protein